jgi:hypothetical protein
MIAHNSEGPWAIPAKDSLRVNTLLVEVGKIRVDNLNRRTIERDPSPHTARWSAVNVASINREVVREHAERGFVTSSEQNNVIYRINVGGGANLQTFKPIDEPLPQSGRRAWSWE